MRGVYRCSWCALVIFGLWVAGCEKHGSDGAVSDGSEPPDVGACSVLGQRTNLDPLDGGRPRRDAAMRAADAQLPAGSGGSGPNGDSGPGPDGQAEDSGSEPDGQAKDGGPEPNSDAGDAGSQATDAGTTDSSVDYPEDCPPPERFTFGMPVLLSGTAYAGLLGIIAERSSVVVLWAVGSDSHGLRIIGLRASLRAQ